MFRRIVQDIAEGCLLAVVTSGEHNREAAKERRKQRK